MLGAYFKAPLRALAPLILAVTSACASQGATEAESGASRGEAETVSGVSRGEAEVVSADTPDPELDTCRARADAVMQLPALPGAPSFDEHRAEFLGRARGEPMVFMREPQPTPDAALRPAWLASRRVFEQGHPSARIGKLRSRHRGDPEAMRALVLREGYAYAPDPLDALGIVSALSLPDLFTEPEIWLQRGKESRRLRREEKRREITYRYVDGPLEGRAADLLFGDRLGLRETDLADPLHRDLRALADVEGFDRTRIKRLTSAAILADLRFGERWVPAVLEAEGAGLRLGCLAADRTTRQAVAETRKTEGPRRRALLRMHDVITEELKEAFRFDRPEGETGPDRDGELRPFWASAYLSGRSSFEHDGANYQVFDGAGNAWPPQVCVDFVVDTFERTSGTWWRPRGPSLGRVRGKLDLAEMGISSRRGVIAFGKLAEQTPDSFDVRRFRDEERIQFRERTRYFDFLAAHADEIRPGDVVAIHGLKRDDRIHQHAILVEWADPITGFPHGLADQMKRPRRRTWEGIMAEAPLRSLLYRVRPRASVFERLDPGP